MINHNRTFLNNTILKPVITAFALACCLLLLPGCSGDSAWEDQAEESTEETTATETAGDAWQEIRLTTNYSYRLPDYSEEVIDFEHSEGFDSEKRFVLNNGDIEVRSFIIMDDEDLFPGLVEYLYRDDENASIGYRNFFDTAVAVADDELTDDNGEVFYRRAYFWPDGGNVLCSVSVTSYSREDAEKAGEDVLKTVRCSDSDVEFGQQGWEIPPNAEDALTPSQEEIDQALMYDIQQAMEDQMREDYEGYMDHDTSLGRGWR